MGRGNRASGSLPPQSLHCAGNREDIRQTTNRYSPHFVASLISNETAEHEAFYRAVDAPFVGDGLVRLDSALGRHRNPALALGVPDDRCLVITQANHWDLLDRAEVTDRMRGWLAD